MTLDVEAGASGIMLAVRSASREGIEAVQELFA
jgi:hypothetical protein